MDFIFIGGTYRGFKVFETLLNHGYKPSLAFFLKEDEHEINKYSVDLQGLASEAQIPYKTKKKLDNFDNDLISSKKRDFIIVCGWRTLIAAALNGSLKLGMVAAHDSLLPRYRGFAPVNWAIINGEQETGVTLFVINEGETDSGAIVAQESVSIGKDEYASEVYEKVTDCTIKLYLKFIDDYQNNSVRLIKQKEEDASYTCKRAPNDGNINWALNSDSIYNLIRGIAHPYPGAFCSFNGNTYHIRKAVLGKRNSTNFQGRIPGRVIGIEDDGIEVMCGAGTIKLMEWENKDKNEIASPSAIVKSITATLT